ncbi:MAG: nucleotide exchange factor GrpE [Candidatus Omnitrophota bacterium]
MVESASFPDFDSPESKEQKQKEVKLALEELWEKESETEPSEDRTEIEKAPEGREAPLSAEIQNVMAERDEYLDHLKRLQAEFDNYRKRVLKERTEMREYLLQEFLVRLLDVAENMERALNPQNHAVDAESHRAGVRMVYQQFLGVLKDYGLTRVETVGEKFDPHFHEAISQVKTAEREPGIILAEISPGYRLKDRVLRAPKVQVAAACEPANKDKEAKEDGDAISEEKNLRPPFGHFIKRNIDKSL